MRPKSPSRSKPKTTRAPKDVTQVILPAPETLTITRASDESDGIAHNSAGQTVFVHGALIGETVNVIYTKQQKQFLFAHTQTVKEASEHRISPLCRYYDDCGGCQQQHMTHDYSVALKQQALQRKLSHHLSSEPSFTTIASDQPFEYRRTTRLAIKWDDKGQEVKLGFRTQTSKHIVSIDRCEVLTPTLNVVLKALGDQRDALFDIAARKRQLGHVELMETENAHGEPRALLSITLAKSVADDVLERWNTFAKEHAITLFIKSHDKADSILQQTDDSTVPVISVLDKYTLHVQPDDFIQVSKPLNNAMVNQVLTWLAPLAPKTVFDLFCGLGNFTLPLADISTKVTGFELNPAMVKRANENVKRHAFTHVNVHQADLMTEEGVQALKRHEKPDVIVLDPPRAGAKIVCENMHKFKASTLIYISCDANAFARDAAQLEIHGYDLTEVVLVDMFAQTAHFETMGLFIKHNRKIKKDKPIRNKYKL